MNVFLDAKQARELTEVNREKIGKTCWDRAQNEIAKYISGAAKFGQDHTYIPIYNVYYQVREASFEGYQNFINTCLAELTKLGYNATYEEDNCCEVTLVVRW